MTPHSLTRLGFGLLACALPLTVPLSALAQGVGVEAGATLYLDIDHDSLTVGKNGPEATTTRTVAELSPQAAYRLTTELLVGGGLLLTHATTSQKTAGGVPASSTTANELGVFALAGYAFRFTELFEAQARLLAGYSRQGISADLPTFMEGGSIESARHNLLLGLEADLTADIAPWLFAQLSARYLFRRSFATNGAYLPAHSASMSHRVMVGVGVGTRF